MANRCPACEGFDIYPFYRIDGITVHSVINIQSYGEALAFPRSDLELAFCLQCGFIFNRLFNAAKMHYCTQCEETQGFSTTFSRWHRTLAQKVIDRYDLRNKSIIEIGCGKGEFLTMLCELAGNRGVGFDPAYVPERNVSSAANRVQFIPDFYSEKYSSLQADFICCKMTLEHIHEPLAFLKTIRRSIGNQFGTKVFFQVPDMRRVLAEIAFWDIYYEHCSYFSLGSLARVFRKASFDVVDITSDYNGQYIMITARVTGAPAQPHVAEGDISSVRREVSHFEQQAAERIAKWRDEFARILGEGRRVVLWGSGSKAVSFLSTVGITKAIDYVVDINPYRQGTYMAGSGQRVISPEFLKQYRPDSVLVMNEIYLEEIQRDLAHLGLNPELKAICGKTLAAA